MDHLGLRHFAVLVALTTNAFLTGAGLYEQAVLDTAWPKKPALVRPVEGGANRKLFWVPANILGLASLLVALWASWPAPAARAASLVALCFSAAIQTVTIGFFAPAVLRVEKDGIAANDPTSVRWVRLSRWRSPLSLGVNASLVVAALALVSAL
jgi:hypothetical protein